MRTLPTRTLMLAAALAVCGTTNAHQTFLFADRYDLLPGKDNYLSLYNGTYYESGYSITRKMSRDISLVMGGERMSIDKAPGGRVDDVDKHPDLVATFIGFEARPDGTGLGGLAAHPDYIALPRPLFRNYLASEGLDDALARFDEESDLSTIRERYTKHAKAIFQVGDTLTDDYRTVLGYKVEIVPENHPGRLSVGDSMTVQVLYDGKPLADQQLYASHASYKPDFDGPVAQGSKHALRTDKEGRATFEITAADKWFVQLINMRRVNDEEADYESNWSTLTFAVK